ncbi:DUF1754-domain-containing protein [Saccharata proteae CBS 121410]|uniref:DUF1754-domain-containing protein n=1 Tax=Saccharata proteae CBS 121410 TaxID=1314787 RepID=A0A9P4LX62_9PEZI|nr:DUF1754-domain-containing protein [Saccharata proteae CBS 121410]
MIPGGFVPGRLRLKGDPAPGAKKKKKKKTTTTSASDAQPAPTTTTAPAPASTASASEANPSASADAIIDPESSAKDAPSESRKPSPSPQPSTITKRSSTPLDREKAEAARYAGMTATQIAFEKRRRERLERQIKREGAKSHRENVEEFNKKLSMQSEHHDMPRIGPG